MYSALVKSKIMRYNLINIITIIMFVLLKFKIKFIFFVLIDWELKSGNCDSLRLLIFYVFNGEGARIQKKKSRGRSY